VEGLVSVKGPNSFYESVETEGMLPITKVEPLNRALKIQRFGSRASGQSSRANRQTMQRVEWDEQYQLIKYTRYLNWTLNQVEQFIASIRFGKQPYTKRDFPSIGCAPCTRAIPSGEDVRGRTLVGGKALIRSVGYMRVSR